MIDFRLGELFCGPGGMGLGAARAKVRGARFSHVWATDNDENACNTYRANLPKTEVVCGDIRAIQEEKFVQLDEAGKINTLVFGFPCNDFSVVGRKAGVAGNFGGLYRCCVEAVKHFAPICFVAENVAGLRSADDGNTLRAIMSEFSALGYRLYPNLYSFDRYGVPQRRQRIMIVGIRRDQEVDFRVPSAAPYADIDISAETALKGIPRDADNHDFTRQGPIVVERLNHILPGQNAFSATLPPHLRLNVGGAKISTIYRRLDPKKPAYTITGSGGGGTHVYHWKEPRALTNRERARLQSFPDDHKFFGSKENVRKQVGMAVPPVGAQVVFEAIAKSFLGIQYPAEDSNMENFWDFGGGDALLRRAS